MLRERQPLLGERRTATALTVSLFLVVLIPVPPGIASDEPGGTPAGVETLEEGNRGGWLRKLFHRREEAGVGKEVPVPRREVGVEQTRGSDRKTGRTEEEEALPKRGIGALGRKLAGFLVPGGRGDRPATTPEGKPRDADGGRRPALGARIDVFVVTEDETRLYEDGPLQPHPTDLKLDAGAIVSIVKWRRGWSDVRLESGEFGTIATDLLRKAKASDFPVEPLAIEAAIPERNGEYVEALLPEMLPLLDSVELPDFPLIQGEEGAMRRRWD